MGASSATGTGPGSAEGVLRGLSLDNIHKVLKPDENKASVTIGNRVQLRGSGAGGDVLRPPRVDRIDAVSGIVYFENPSGAQIEVYKYTRKKAGSHIKKDDTILTPHLGKRYKPLLQLPMGATSWTVPDRFIYPVKGSGNTGFRNYFRFGTRDQNGERSDLSVLTVATAADVEYLDGDGIRILVMGQAGVG